MAPDGLTLTSPDGATTAEFIPSAAMLCCSWRVRGEELLDPGHGVDAYATQGKTMAIPLLYPWANRLAAFDYSAAGHDVTLPDDRARIPADPNDLPIHGLTPGLMSFAALPHASGDPLVGTLDWADGELLALFPYQHELRLTAHVRDSTLTITTTVRATGEDRVPVSFGFHPYLRLPGSSRTTWRLDLPPADHLLLDDKMIPTGATEPAPQGEIELGDSSWDDAYKPHDKAPRYAVTDGRRTVEVSFDEGYAYSQIYAPPGKDFICFEPMTAPTNALRSGDALPVIEPGETYSASFTVIAR
jgi:galactose mutarotase-like enzyme